MCGMRTPSADAHYNATGWHEGRDPDAFFSTSIYLSANPDVKAAGVNPLTHFDQSGWKEGRIPSLTFDPRQYLDANPDVAAAHVDPLAHFLQSGAQEGRQPFAPSELIDAERLRLRLLPAAQSRCRGRACRSVPAFPDDRLEGRAQSERALRRRMAISRPTATSRRRTSIRSTTTISSAGTKAAIPRSASTRPPISRPMPTSPRPASIRSRTSSTSESMKAARPSRTASGGNDFCVGAYSFRKTGIHFFRNMR